MHQGHLRRIRNKKVGIVLQDFALVENYSVIENVMLPLYFSKKKEGRKQRVILAKELLSQMEMEQMADKKVNKLSGGQKQRVAIARAMINNPNILLADEPTGALDVKTSREIMDVFKKLNEEGATIIIITHDMEVAKATLPDPSITLTSTSSSSPPTSVQARPFTRPISSFPVNTGRE